jgi:hypothetical protein
MGEWWNETDEHRPKWWRYAPFSLIPPARLLHRSTKALRWEDEPFPTSRAMIAPAIYKRIAALWDRLYFSRSPVTGLLPAPPTPDEFDAEINELQRAIQAAQRELGPEDPQMNRLTCAFDLLDQALAAYPTSPLPARR